MKIKDPFNLIDPAQRNFAEDLMETFRGHLSLTQIAEGIVICLRNAQALHQDATILSASARWGRALSLLVVAMEEIGKISVLYSMARIPKTNQKLWLEAWTKFRSHMDKSTWAFVHTYPDEGRSQPDRIMMAAAMQRELAGLCERMRQYGLYVDFHATNKRWLSPEEIVEADVAEWFERVNVCLERCEKFQSLGLYSQKALEIQREVYAALNGDLPRQKELSPDYFDKYARQATEVARLYFNRLVAEGIIPSDADLTVLGEAIGPLESSRA